MIKKIGNQYRVLSEKTNRNMGTYLTKSSAQSRLKQIEMFKHMKSSGIKLRGNR